MSSEEAGEYVPIVVEWTVMKYRIIQSKSDLRYFLHRDKVALGKTNARFPLPVKDVIWKYEILLRKTEFYKNSRKGLIGSIMYAFYAIRKKNLGNRLGFSVPENVFGPGLSIGHVSPIVVNSQAKVGCNCRLNDSVTIGATNGSSKAPVLGDNCFIGSGARLIGDISIADDVAVGAGAVVVKTIDEANTTWGGVPARKISSNGSQSNLNAALFDEDVE
jgi:serine O-acetyltransferase